MVPVDENTSVALSRYARGWVSTMQSEGLSAERALAPGDPLWPLVTDAWAAAAYSLWYGPMDAFTSRLWRRVYEIQIRELPADHPQVGSP